MTKQETISIKVTGKAGNRDIQKKYDSDYLESLIDKATPRWKGIDADEWLGELRGDYESVKRLRNS